MKAAFARMTLLSHPSLPLNFGRITSSASQDALMVQFLTSLRDEPTGVLDPHNSSINLRIRYGSEKEFKRMFRVSRNVFESILGELLPFLSDGKSLNPQKNTPAHLKLVVALYYMAHGGDAVHLEAASGLSKATALKYVHEVAELICSKLAIKWMGPALLNQEGYMENNRARFSLRNGFPYVGAAIDGTHVPYVPNAGEYEQDYKNYKMWTSMLCIGIVNSNHVFLDMDVGWPGRLHDKTCTEHSQFWNEMHRDRKLWLGEDGVAVADTAWGAGSELVMTPYTTADGSTESQQWYNFVHSSTRFFVEETYGRWKNRFRCLINGLKFANAHSKMIIFATAVLHNICTLCNDLEDFYFDGTDGSSFGFPASPLSLYNHKYPLEKVVCPRCKKKSNGVMTSIDRCDCFRMPLIERAPAALLARQPNIRNDLKSSDPIVRREAYRRLLFTFKPDDFHFDDE